MRHSFGHTVAVSAGCTAVFFAFLLAASGDGFLTPTPVLGALAGLGIGSVAGGIAGSIISGTRKRPVFYIANNLATFKQVKELLISYLPNANPEKTNYNYETR